MTRFSMPQPLFTSITDNNDAFSASSHSMSSPPSNRTSQKAYHHINRTFNQTSNFSSVQELKHAFKGTALHISPLYPGIPIVLVYAVRSRMSKHGVPTHSVTLTSAAMLGSYSIIKLKPADTELLGIPKIFRNNEFVVLLQKGNYLSQNVQSIAVRGIMTPSKSNWVSAIAEIKEVLNQSIFKSQDFFLLADMLEDDNIATSEHALSVISLLDFVPTDLYESHSSRIGYFTPSTIPRLHLTSHLSREYDYAAPLQPVMPYDIGYPKAPELLKNSELDAYIRKLRKHYQYKVIGLEVKANDPAKNADPTRWVLLSVP